jgi:carbohydrate-binding DOMON domain-containing protein
VSIHCTYKKPTDSGKNNYFSIDTTKIVILQYDSTSSWIFENCTQTELTDNDLELSDSLLTICINDYNVEQEERYEEICNEYPNIEFHKEHFVIDLTKYRRQYICVTNERAEKELWINFHCESFFSNPTYTEEWKTGIVLIKDGGNCFFSLKINLTTKKYYNLLVNGFA